MSAENSLMEKYGNILKKKSGNIRKNAKNKKVRNSLKKAWLSLAKTIESKPLKVRKLLTLIQKVRNDLWYLFSPVRRKFNKEGNLPSGYPVQ